MNILFVTGSMSRLAGGLFETVRKTAQQLIRYSEVDLRVVAVEDVYSENDLQHWVPVIPHSMKAYGPTNLGYMPSFFDYLNSQCLDLIHSHGIWMYSDYVISKMKKRQSFSYVVTPQGMLDPWALQNSRWKKWVAEILYEKKFLTRASCLHSLNHSETQSMRDYGLKGPFCQIPNGIDLSDSSMPTYPPPWKTPFSGDKKIVLYLGRIHPKKGLSQLLHGWKQFQFRDAQSAKQWGLIIVGWDQGGHETALKKLCRELGLESSVHFAGPLHGEAKHAAFQNADAFILPSFSEGLPMAVLEAWQHKLPVLMTVSCNLPEGFEEDAAVHIGNSPESIAHGLSKLASMGEKHRSEMGHRGFRLLETTFNWEKIAADLHAVYTWILGGGTPPECVLLK